MTLEPPRLALWLLARRLSPEWHDFLVGDLVEEFRVRATVSPSRARRWFWRQTLHCLASPPLPPRAADTHTLASGDSFMRTLAADLRYAVRVLSRAPSFALAVIAVLALGIGANVAIFSIVNSVLLRPLPFDEPDRLVRLFHIPPQSTFPGMATFSVSAANFYDWKRDARLFEGMAIYRFRRFTLTGRGNAEAIVAGAVGADFFELTRVGAARGRVFLPEEDSPGRGHVVIVSDGFWKRRLGGGEVIGQTLTLDGEPYTIVGVMPQSFSIASWGGSSRELWVPLAYTEADRAVRENHNAQVVARLKPNVSLAEAKAEMTVISARLEQEYPQANAGWGATVIPLQELIVGDVRLPLVMLLAAVALVLLIACANVGNLLFARALGRTKEIAIRSALGAGRGRVFQQLLVESLLLSGVGGIAGLLLAHAGLSAGTQLLSDQLPRADELSIDGRVLAFVATVSVVTGIVAGALPALRAGRVDLNGALKEGGRSDAGVGVRTRRALIVCEVALSLVLLMGAAVMLRSLAALRSVDTGINPHDVLTMNVELPATRYDTPAKRTAFFDTLLERVRALPGVEAAGGVDDLPTQGGSVQPIVLEGHAELLPRDQPTVEVRKVMPGYVRAMAIPIVAGRDVAASDADVLLVSRSAAKLLWRDDDPVGRRITLPLQSRTVTLTVVGIVGDVKHGELAQSAAPTVYEYTRERNWSGLSVVMRTSVPSMAVAQSATAVVRALDPDQPVQNVRTMNDVLETTLTFQRFSAVLLGLFASVALSLASVGIYSVLSYIVRGRSREIGIRTALGARTTDVLRLVVLEGMTPSAIGIVVGAVAAVASARFIKTLVFDVSASDPLILAAVAGVLLLVSLLASLVPALRATRLDPLKVLRSS